MYRINSKRATDLKIKNLNCKSSTGKHKIFAKFGRQTFLKIQKSHPREKNRHIEVFQV